jgi:hypothetical protein
MMKLASQDKNIAARSTWILLELRRSPITAKSDSTVRRMTSGNLPERVKGCYMAQIDPVYDAEHGMNDLKRLGKWIRLILQKV